MLAIDWLRTRSSWGWRRSRRGMLRRLSLKFKNSGGSPRASDKDTDDARGRAADLAFWQGDGRNKEVPIREGWLKKRSLSQSIGSNWKRRYFRLYADRLLYGEEKGGGMLLLGGIPLCAR